jgi:elongator complex protein 3
MPKSYLSDEPGAQRAAANRFDPYLQTWNRLAAYRAIGHPTDKVEIIVLGGTWSFHPEAYQVWFAARCFEALADFGAGLDGRAACETGAPRFDELPARVDGRAHAATPYNRIVSGFLQRLHGGELVAAGEQAGWERLEAAQRANESAACRCVGFVVETRPDHLREEEVIRIRRLGATKVQIGIQSLDDDVLAANRRGHDVEATRTGIARLRLAGFKIHAHWMPNLLHSTPEKDARDFARLFDDPAIRPDELKIYPCSLIESAELMRHHERGEWRAYAHAELLDLLASALARVPRYCRVTRVIRDISSDDIVTGNKLTNFRQLAEQEVARRGGRCRDIRAREIRGGSCDLRALVLRATAYDAGVSEEQFLELTTREDRIVAFLRLSLPREKSFVSEIAGSAVIREVHVYGGSLALGDRSQDKPQHRGLGGRLVEEAAQRAREAGFERLTVISAIGTRDWYRRLGFQSTGLYQQRCLSRA